MLTRMTRILVLVVLGAVSSAPASVAIAQELELQTVEFHSPAVDRTMKYNVLLPRGYEESTERYPVLYLLHGVGQNYTTWGRSNGAPFYAGLFDDLIRGHAGRRQLVVHQLCRRCRRADEQLGGPHRSGCGQPRRLALPDDRKA